MSWPSLVRSMVSAVTLSFALSAHASSPPWSPATTRPSSDFTRLYESSAAIGENGIDRFVFFKLRRANVQPAPVCSDAVFLRRAYLDVIGTLPTPQEAKEFLRDQTPGKRAALVNRLLERDEFADYWAMKWCDLLRVKAEFPINLWPNAAQAYHHWIRQSIHDNKPYDKFARELLTSSGSNFRVPPVNFYRASQSRQPEGLARTVALTLMGERAEKWPTQRLAAMSMFFSQVGYKSTGEWKEEIVFWDANKAPTTAATSAPTTRPVFPDGTAATLSGDRDPREVFADWLLAPRNPYFSNAIVNRVWFWLLGRGIIHEPDDIRPDNPPSNPELLAYLQRELVNRKYDLKQIYRLILLSKTYQLSCIARSQHERGESLFASYPMRRLEAEVLADALCQITGSTEKYTSAIPEPYTFVPESERSIALPDGSITSAFLELFGRPPRDSGLELERNNRPAADQRLHMLNSSHIQRKLEMSQQLRQFSQNRRPLSEIVPDAYLLILSRYPTAQELNDFTDYAAKKSRREAVIDLAWALINSDEFIYRH